MTIFLLVAVPLVLFLVWALVYDRRQRRLGATPHDVGGAARQLRTETEGKGTEGSLGT